MDNFLNEIEMDSLVINEDSICLDIDSITIDDVGNCYCCREETTSRSPCICRTHMCDSCLLIYSNYNRNCTICNSELDIYIPSPTNTINSNGYLSLSYSFDDNYLEYYHFDFVLIIKTVYFFLSVVLLLALINFMGCIGNHYVMNIPIRFSYDHVTFLMGGLYLTFTLIVTFALGTLIFCIFNIISMILFYFSCGYIHG